MADRVSCPRCGTVVPLPPTGSPRCPTCGFAGPAPPDHAPQGYAPPTWAPGQPLPVAPAGGRQSNTKAVVALVFGILGLAVFPLLGIVGWILGVQARNEIRSDPMQEGDGMATAGIVLGIVSVVMLGLLILYFVFVFAFVFGAG